MKITSQNSTSASVSGTGGAQEIQKPGNSGAGAGAKSGAGGDSVEFSSTLGSLSRAMESFNNSRVKVVQSISAQYRSGAYQVDAAATSRGLISEALSG